MLSLLILATFKEEFDISVTHTRACQNVINYGMTTLHNNKIRL